MRKTLLTLLASAALAQPGAAQEAQAQASFASGATVSDTAGGAVGTITSVDGEFVVLKTDKHEVRLPSNAFTPHEGKLLFAMTQAELNAQVEAAAAQAQAQIAPQNGGKPPHAAIRAKVSVSTGPAMAISRWVATTASPPAPM